MDHTAFHFPINARPRKQSDKNSTKPDPDKVQIRRRIEDIEEQRRLADLFIL